MPQATHRKTTVDFGIIAGHTSIDNVEGNTGAPPGWVRVERGGKDWCMDLIEFLEQYELDSQGPAYIKRRLKAIGQWEQRRDALRRFGIE
jgi:hypothetical protein